MFIKETFIFLLLWEKTEEMLWIRIDRWTSPIDYFDLSAKWEEEEKNFMLSAFLKAFRISAFEAFTLFIDFISSTSLAVETLKSPRDKKKLLQLIKFFKRNWSEFFSSKIFRSRSREKVDFFHARQNFFYTFFLFRPKNDISFFSDSFLTRKRPTPY